MALRLSSPATCLTPFFVFCLFLPCLWLRQDDVGSKPDAAAQGRGGVKGLGKKGNQYAARLAAEARQALAVRQHVHIHKIVTCSVWFCFILFLSASASLAPPPPTPFAHHQGGPFYDAVAMRIPTSNPCLFCPASFVITTAKVGGSLSAVFVPGYDVGVQG